MLALDAPAHVRSRVTSIVDVVWEEYDVVIDLFSILFRLELDLVVILTIPNMLFFLAANQSQRKLPVHSKLLLPMVLHQYLEAASRRKRRKKSPGFHFPLWTI